MSKFGVVIFPGSNCDQDMIYVLREIMGQEVIELWHKDADLKVNTGFWVYCPKNEWKSLTRRVKPVVKKVTEEGSENKPITKRGKYSIQ